MRKRHRYVTVIACADTNKTLAMIEHRSSAALTAFLMSQPHRWRRGVKVVVTDGSAAYKASLHACLPHARHMLDRFHVIRWFCAGLTAVRRDIQRRPEGSKPAFDPEVFKARFALLRRGDTLTDADRARLDALFDTHPRLRAGWQALHGDTSRKHLECTKPGRADSQRAQDRHRTPCCTDVVFGPISGTREALSNLSERASELVLYVGGGGRI